MGHFDCVGVLTTRQPLCVVSLRKGEKSRRDGRREEREEKGRKRIRHEREETEEIKTFPLYLYLLQGKQALPSCKPISTGCSSDTRYMTHSHQPTTLWVILCRLPEQGRKQTEELVQEMKKRNRDWLSWSLTKRQPLWVILCHLPEKGTKEIGEIAEEMKVREREERETGMKVQYECIYLTSYIQNFCPIFYYCDQLSFIATVLPESMLPVWQKLVSQRPFLRDFTLIKRLLEQMSKYRTKLYRKFLKDQGSFSGAISWYSRIFFARNCNKIPGERKKITRWIFLISCLFRTCGPFRDFRTVLFDRFLNYCNVKIHYIYNRR